MLVTVILSAAVAAVRVGGLTHPAFQAAAHLWVGGLIGYGVKAGRRYWGQAAVLSAVEVAVFAATRL